MLRTLRITGVGIMLLIAASVTAQHQHSPYAGHEASEIPSLTPTELEQLRDGEGMGFAKPAELNRFPGPRHILDLAADLELTAEQVGRTQQVFDDMQRTARALGGQIIEAERTLNMRFANHHIDDTALREMTASIAALYGDLRFAHLQAHLQTEGLLQPAQVEAYDRLRGYRQ